MSLGGEREIAWRVLTWNLKHGRAVPSAGRDLTCKFTEALRGWEWDLALLQEVPPWWPPQLAVALDADQRTALTSRNFGLWLRRPLAIRWPDAIKSNGGGANAILVRHRVGWIAEHRKRRLSWLPERRWVHGVRLEAEIGPVWVCNLHAASDADQGRLAASTALAWASRAPVLLGGDFNVRSLSLDGFEHVAGHHVDHVYVRGLACDPASATALERGELSDHDPVAVAVTAITPSSRGGP